MGELYIKWLEQVKKMLPREPKTRQVNLVHLLMGIFLAKAFT